MQKIFTCVCVLNIGVIETDFSTYYCVKLHSVKHHLRFFCRQKSIFKRNLCFQIVQYICIFESENIE